MKLAFVVLSVLATTVFAAGNLELTKKIIMAKDACKGAGVTLEDMQNFMNKQVPQTKTGQCFVACVGKKMGVITDNKINIAQIKTLTADMKDKNPEKYDEFTKVVEACANETDNDKCEAAKKITQCVRQKLPMDW